MTTQTIKTTAATMLAALEQCRVCVADDDSRPVLAGIRVERSETTLKFTSADGFRLMHVSTVSMHGEGADADFIIGTHKSNGGDAFKALQVSGQRSERHFGRARGCLQCDQETNTIHAQVGCQTITLSIVQGSYPDYTKLIPERGTASAVAFDADLIGEIIMVAGKFISAGRAPRAKKQSVIRFFTTGTRKPIRMEWSTLDWTAIAVAMPIFAADLEAETVAALTAV